MSNKPLEPLVVSFRDFLQILNSTIPSAEGRRHSVRLPPATADAKHCLEILLDTKTDLRVVYLDEDDLARDAATVFIEIKQALDQT